jgi:hypothetical protein
MLSKWKTLDFQSRLFFVCDFPGTILGELFSRGWECVGAVENFLFLILWLIEILLIFGIFSIDFDVFFFGLGVAGNSEKWKIQISRPTTFYPD